LAQLCQSAPLREKTGESRFIRGRVAPPITVKSLTFHGSVAGAEGSRMDMLWLDDRSESDSLHPGSECECETDGFGANQRNGSRSMSRSSIAATTASTFVLAPSRS
jgi:hypothetical protein